MGLVIGTNSSGGLCGRNAIGEISDCFWDMETSEMTVGYNLYSPSPGTITNVIGKTTQEMQTQSTFTDAGWDFDSTWWINDGVDYPLLIW